MHDQSLRAKYLPSKQYYFAHEESQNMYLLAVSFTNYPEISQLSDPKEKPLQKGNEIIDYATLETLFNNNLR